MELNMDEVKSVQPLTIPEADDQKENPVKPPGEANQTQIFPANITSVTKELADKNMIVAESVPKLANELIQAQEQSEHSKKFFQPPLIWILLAIVPILFILLLLIVSQSKQGNELPTQVPNTQENEVNANDSGVSGIISKSKTLRLEKFQILLLVDDDFAGKAPMEVNSSGPLVSIEKDPEIAALVDALKTRLEILEGSKTTIRGNIVTKQSSGIFRGFKINTMERTENQNILVDETIVITPQKGIIKTVNHVLDSIRESDFERFSAELQNAGLEIVRLPVQPDNKTVRMQLKCNKFIGNPISSDFIISGNSVGKITVGMSTVQMETLLVSSFIVLKRKVLVNDIYYDVYKVLDQNNDPLLYVYENKGKVWGISIISEKFRTDRNIGIGSSLGNIRINYPQVRLGYSEKKTPFLLLESVNGLFIIQSEAVDFSQRIFPNETKVISILIGDSPEFE
jgi:hypothetical protein